MIILIKNILLSNWLYIDLFAALTLCYGVEEIWNWNRFNKIGTLVHYNRWKPSIDMLFTAVFSCVTIITLIRYLEVTTTTTMMVFLIHIMLFLRFSIRTIQRSQIFEHGFKHHGHYYLWESAIGYKWQESSEEGYKSLELIMNTKRIRYEIELNRVDAVNTVLQEECREKVDSPIFDSNVDQAV